MHFGTHITDVLLDFPDTLAAAPFATEQRNIAGIALRIVSTNQTKQGRLPCPVFAAECPLFAALHRPVEFFQNHPFSVTDTYLVQIYNVLCMKQVIGIRQVQYPLPFLVRQHMSRVWFTVCQIFLQSDFRPAMTVFHRYHVCYKCRDVVCFRQNQNHLQVGHLSQFSQQRVQQSPGPRIQSDERIVHNQYSRTTQQGLGQLKFTEFSARQQNNMLAEHLLNAKQIVQRFPQLFVLAGRKQIGYDRRIVQILRIPALLVIIVPVGIPVRVTKRDVLDIVASHLRLRRREVIFHLIHQQRIASGNGVYQQTLSAAVRSYDGHMFSCRNLQVHRLFHPVQRMTSHSVLNCNYILHCLSLFLFCSFK